jgi:hypothetical protein
VVHFGMTASGVRIVTRYGIAGLALVFAVPVLSQDSAMLSRLEAGQWELRGAGNARIAVICLGNPIQLTQPRHRGVNCTRDVVAADADSMTVSYSCPGIGRGRTTLRFETPRLIQIESQGLDRGAPFALRAEARRIGPC